MQFFKYNNSLTLTITLGLLMSISAPCVHALGGFALPDMPELTPTKIASAAAVTLILKAVWDYNSKKTEPKRVLPRDNSFEENAKFIWNELIVGQAEKPERASRVEYDPLNPTELCIKYEKIDARGLVGVTHSYVKNIILPTMMFVIVYNTFKKDIIKSVQELTKIVADPKTLIDFSTSAPVIAAQ